MAVPEAMVGDLAVVKADWTAIRKAPAAADMAVTGASVERKRAWAPRLPRDRPTTVSSILRILAAAAAARMLLLDRMGVVELGGVQLSSTLSGR